MILKVLFGRRIESYADEYAPEALEIADEYTDDENPDFITDKLKEYQKQEIFDSLEIVEIEVNEDKIKSILRPANRVEGKIK